MSGSVVRRPCLSRQVPLPLSDAAVSSLHADLYVDGVIAQSSQLQSLIQRTHDKQSIVSL